jgi:hypothetical protein
MPPQLAPLAWISRQSVAWPCGAPASNADSLQRGRRRWLVARGDAECMRGSMFLAGGIPAFRMPVRDFRQVSAVEPNETEETKVGVARLAPLLAARFSTWTLQYLCVFSHAREDCWLADWSGSSQAPISIVLILLRYGHGVALRSSL